MRQELRFLPLLYCAYESQRRGLPRPHWNLGALFVLWLPFSLPQSPSTHFLATKPCFQSDKQQGVSRQRSCSQKPRSVSRDRPWEAQRGVSRPRAASKTCYLLTGGGSGQVWTEEEKTQGKHVLTQSFHSSMVSFEEVASVRNSRLLVQEKQNVFFTAQYHLVKLKIYHKRTMPILQEPIQTEGYKHITYIRMVVYEE